MTVANWDLPFAGLIQEVGILGGLAQGEPQVSIDATKTRLFARRFLQALSPPLCGIDLNKVNMILEGNGDAGKALSDAREIVVPNFSKEFSSAAPLRSIGSKIFRGEQSQLDLGILPAEWRDEHTSLFPATYPKRDFQPEYKALYDNLIEKMNAIRVTDGWKYMAQAIQEFENHTWSVPENPSDRECDVSLFDRMRTISAVAACLHRAENKDKPFLFVSGDFGGIQKYIYGIPHKILKETGSAKGSSKALRGRSLRVRLITEDIATRILYETNCSLAHRILTAGGRLYLLLPNTAECRTALQSCDRNLGEWSLRTTNGELRFNLAHIELSKSNVREFGNAQRLANEALEDRASRPLGSVLTAEAAWKTDEFLRKIPADDRSFEPDRKLGEDIPRNDAVLLMENPIGSELPFSTAKFSDDEDLRNTARIVLRWPKDKPSWGVRARVSRYVPRNAQREILTFEEIAEQAQGRKALGFFRADIDNLGYIFGNALTKTSGGSSLTRVVALSRTLEGFAAGYVDELIEKEFKCLYVVYSGGDDMFLVGPWDQMIAFAIRLREELTRYMSGNSQWGISAGIYIATPGTPILGAAEAAENLLSKAKAQPEKNALAVFDQVLDWKSAKAGLDQGNQLVSWIKNDIMSVSQIRRHLGYAKMKQEYQDLLKQIDNTQDVSALSGKYKHALEPHPLRYAYLLENDLIRNWGKRIHDLRQEKLQALEWAERLTSSGFEHATSRVFSCKYVLNAIRTKVEE